MDESIGAAEEDDESFFDSFFDRWDQMGAQASNNSIVNDRLDRASLPENNIQGRPPLPRGMNYRDGVDYDEYMNRRRERRGR